MQRSQEYLRKVSTAEGEAFAASLDPPWMFMECSAKLGGETIVGSEGVFSRVVDQVRLPFPPLSSSLTRRQIIQTPQLYTKPILPASNHSGPPGTYPRGTVTLGDEGGVTSWCAC
jgi:Ras-related protein Rab-18